MLDAAATREAEPALTGPVAGAVRYPDEARVDPELFVEAVGRAAVAAGAEIRTGVEVRSLDELRADVVVVAAGAWSRRLVRLPLEGGKGYHVDFERSPDDPQRPTWVQETWTIATPLPSRLRLSGTLELAGLDLSISQPRVDAIRRGGDRWFRGLAGRTAVETWAGLRPCLPDGLPAIGWLGRRLVATGHAMKGVSLAPVTGRLVAQLAAGETTAHDLAPADPARGSSSDRADGGGTSRPSWERRRELVLALDETMTRVARVELFPLQPDERAPGAESPLRVVADVTCGQEQHLSLVVPLRLPGEARAWSRPRAAARSGGRR